MCSIDYHYSFPFTKSKLFLSCYLTRAHYGLMPQSKLIHEPLFLRSGLPFKFRVLMALHIKDNGRKADLNMLEDTSSPTDPVEGHLDTLTVDYEEHLYTKSLYGQWAKGTSNTSSLCHNH